MSWIATPLTRKKTYKISSSHSIATHHIHIPADPKNATVAVVKELARRIEMAIEEPDTTPMPPVEFLIMVRLIVMLVEDCKGKMGFSKYSFLNTRYYYEVSGETLTWEEAMGFINRSDRFLRMIRSMAYGPMNVPPRLIRIEQKVWDIYDDQILNNANRWNRQTFEEMTPVALHLAPCDQRRAARDGVKRVVERDDPRTYAAQIKPQRAHKPHQWF